MSRWIYKKPEPTHIRGLCIVCDKNPQKKTSKGTYQALCSTCDAKRFNYRLDGRDYVKHKGDVCNRCGFIPEDKCQLDVHHIDENHHNNDPNNLETVCANCHRLIHKQNKPLETLNP